MWKDGPRTRKKEVLSDLSSHHVESSRPSLTTVSLEVPFNMVNDHVEFTELFINQHFASSIFTVIPQRREFCSIK